MRKLFTLILIAASMCILTACGKNKEIYDSGEDGYTAITSVDGISFDVVSDAARNATAVTNISEDMAFETDQTYMYKDGETEYFLFRIDSIVCVAQKGTSFGLKDAEDKLDAVAKGNILGIYFSSPRKKLEFIEDEKDDVYKMVATVTAQVVLTNELYNDFAGRLAYINDGQDEWTMFVGTIGQDFRGFSDETKQVITYMAATMSLHEKPVRAETPEPAVALGGENEPDTNVETVSGNTMADAENEEPKDEKDSMELEKIEVGTVVEETAEDILLFEDEDSAQEDKPGDDEPDAQPESEDKASEAIRLNNQRNTVKDDMTVYTSNIYDMLDVGKHAYADVLLSDASGYQRAEIKADQILTGAEAVAVIHNAYNKGIMMGNYFTPPEGCAFHVIHYTVVFPEGRNGYVNVKLRGMDGENLRFRGIPYTQRTYDIRVSDTEFYAFYAVPNACKEYAVEMGDGTVNNEQSGIISAYYRYSSS